MRMIARRVSEKSRSTDGCDDVGLKSVWRWAEVHVVRYGTVSSIASAIHHLPTSTVFDCADAEDSSHDSHLLPDIGASGK